MCYLPGISMVITWLYSLLIHYMGAWVDQIPFDMALLWENYSYTALISCMRGGTSGIATLTNIIQFGISQWC